MERRSDLPHGFIVADDLTGAADAAVAFVGCGLSAAVVFDRLSAASRDAAVVSMSTDSRSLPAGRAAVLVRDAMTTAREAGARAGRGAWLFKKIDSTLRGHVGVEIAAALEASRADLAIVAPAFPAMGRTIEGGLLRLSGDQAVPPLDALERLTIDSAYACARVTCASASSRLTWRHAMSAARAAHARVLLCDSVTQDDLDAIVDAAAGLDRPLLWVGSAGLARAVARHVGKTSLVRRGTDEQEWTPGGRANGALAIPPRAPGTVLFAIGSTNAVTRGQVDALLGGSPSIVRAAVADADTIRQHIEAGGTLLVDVPYEAPDDQVRRLANLVAARPASIGGLILSGGDTAARLCGHLGATRIALGGEVSPGMPWGHLVMAGGRRWPVVLKAGGFGTRDGLVQALAFLSRSSSPSSWRHMDSVDTDTRAPRAASAPARPTIAIAAGDPAGIGPEVVLKALADPSVAPLATWVVVGDRDVLARTARTCGVSLDVLRDMHPIDALDGHTVVPGQLDAACGKAAVAYVREAVERCLRGEADAMVTAPVNKEAVSRAGMPFSGHTEYIAALCGARDSRMLLTNPRLSVVHVTTHVALRQACETTVERVTRTIALGHEAMGRLGLSQPRIAVCGVNPHAGEHGLFGTEEDTVVRPAIEASRANGIACEGPFAPDTIFMEAWRGRWDLVVAMYHDQGHIPMKLLDFANTVNVTLGLPIVRTSVDHGTAFDIAGTNQADPTSMRAALRLAVRLAAARTKGLTS